MKQKQILKEATSNFYDFSQNRRWDWILQSIVFPKVKFYYDKVQKAYCREVINVKGVVIDGCFYPRINFVVNYPQKYD